LIKEIIKELNQLVIKVKSESKVILF